MDQKTVRKLERELEKAIATAPYPWQHDRGQVMSHLDNPAIHENETAKRSRIRQELSNALGPLEKELQFLREDVRDMRAELKELMP